MKRLGLSAVLFSLALSAPASGQGVAYKWFYEGCGIYSCHWLSIAEPQPLGDGWLVQTYHTWDVFAHWPDVGQMGGMFGGSELEDFGDMFYGFVRTGSLLAWFDTRDHLWTPAPTLWVGMSYGSDGCFDHGPCEWDHEEPDPRDRCPFGDDCLLAEDRFDVRLVKVAVPEPAIGLLLMVGLAGVGLRRRRERIT